MRAGPQVPLHIAERRRPTTAPDTHPSLHHTCPGVEDNCKKQKIKTSAAARGTRYSALGEQVQDYAHRECNVKYPRESFGIFLQDRRALYMHKAFTGYTHVGGSLSCFSAGPVRTLLPMHPRGMMGVWHGLLVGRATWHASRLFRAAYLASRADCRAAPIARSGSERATSRGAAVALTGPLLRHG